MGRGGLAGVSARMRRLARREPRSEVRRHLRVHRVLLRARLWPLVLSRGAADDSAAPARERRAAVVHLFHDFRSKDDARFARRTRALRGGRRVRRVVRPVPDVQNERSSVVAGRMLDARAAHRPHCTRLAVRVGRAAVEIKSSARLAGRVVARPCQIRRATCATKSRNHEARETFQSFRVFRDFVCFVAIAGDVDSAKTVQWRSTSMRRTLFAATLALIVASSTPTILGFCGFYISKADTKLFNRASQVVIVRDGDRTVLTMANDFEGEPKEFAVVIPVPTFIAREQIHVGEKTLIDHLDAYSAPRLVEYFDQNPCTLESRFEFSMAAPRAAARAQDAANLAKALGVRIEATYTVG